MGVEHSGGHGRERRTNTFSELYNPTARARTRPGRFDLYSLGTTQAVVLGCGEVVS